MTESRSWESVVAEVHGIQRRGNRLLWLGTALVGVAVVLEIEGIGPA